jgi:alcohol dehydrogenase class IV
MLEFIYQAFPARVVFGPGKVSDIPGEVERLGGESALVISTGSQRAVADEAIEALAQDIPCGSMVPSCMCRVTARMAQ